MQRRVVAIFAIAVLGLVPTASWADLAPFSQDFEALEQADPAALTNDGWLVFANVSGPDWSYWYGYGAVAPNGTPGFSSIAVGQGGPGQGLQQLVTYSDYNNGNHTDGSGAYIQANVYQEQLLTAADVGTTWRFDFDAKRGDIGGGTAANAFFKTILLDPCCSETNVISLDMTNIPDTWGSYSLSIYIDPGLEGQALQFGFANLATNEEQSGMFYDNIRFGLAPLDANLDVRPGSCPNPINRRSQGVLPAALLGNGEIDLNDVDVASLRLEGAAPIDWGFEDVAEPYAGDTCGCSNSGPDGTLDLVLHFSTQDIIAVIGSLPNGDVELTLTGALLDGTPIEGQDCVVLVGGNRWRLAQELQSQVEGADLVDLQLTEDDHSEPGAPEESTRALRNRSRRSRSR